MNHWWEFAREHDVPQLDAGHAGQVHLAHFVGFLFDKGLAGSTIRTYVVSVKSWHREYMGIPVKETKFLKRVLEGALTETPAPAEKPPISAELLKKALQPLVDGWERDSNPDDLVLLVLILVGYATAWRVSNFAYALGGAKDRHMLRWSGVCVEGDKVSVLQRSSKTARLNAERPRRKWIKRTGDRFCPVLWLSCWFRLVSQVPGFDGSWFVACRLNKTLVTNEDINRYLKAQGKRLGLKHSFTSKLLRSSAATAATVQGASRRAVHRLGSWVDPAGSRTAEGSYLDDDKVTLGDLTPGLMSTTERQLSRGRPVTEVWK